MLDRAYGVRVLVRADARGRVRTTVAGLLESREMVMTRAHARRLIALGQVLVDGVPVRDETACPQAGLRTITVVPR